MIWRPLQASLATAQKTYALGKGNPDKSKNIFGAALFDALLRLDESRQKKYVHAFCRWVYEGISDSLGGKEIPPGSLLTALFGHYGSLRVLLYPDQDHPKWGSELASIDWPVSFVRDCVNLLERARERNIPLRDVNSFRTFSDFQKYVRVLDQRYALSQERKNVVWAQTVRKVLSRPENSEVLTIKKTNSAYVIPLRTYSELWSLVEDLVGSETHWCVGRKEAYWNEYITEGSLFYLIVSLIPATDEDRLYLLEQIGGSWKHFKLWNWDNTTLDSSHAGMVLDSLGIDPKSLISFEPDPGYPEIEVEDIDDEWD